MISGICLAVVRILDQDQEATLKEVLMDMEVDVDLRMATVGMGEDLEVAILEVTLDKEEEGENTVVRIWIWKPEWELWRWL